MKKTWKTAAAAAIVMILGSFALLQGCGGGGGGSTTPAVAPQAASGAGKLSAVVKLTNHAATARSAGQTSSAVNVTLTVSGVYAGDDKEFPDVSTTAVIDMAQGSASVSILSVPVGVNHLLTVTAAWSDGFTETLMALIPAMPEGETVTVVADPASTALAEASIHFAELESKRLTDLTDEEITKLEEAIEAVHASGTPYQDIQPEQVISYLANLGVPSSITLNAPTGDIVAGNTFQFTGEVLDGNGTPLSGATVTYTFSDANVGTIDSSGLFTAITSGSGVITAAFDTLTATASVTMISAQECGNGAIETGETCDDGNSTTETCAYGEPSCTVCDAACQSAAGAVAGYCGDSTIQSGDAETCDDGANNGQPNYCNSSCSGAVPATCGNGTAESGEDCDDGAESGICDADCTFAVCGDNALNTTAGESCDDGNKTTETCVYGEPSCTVCDSKCASVAGAASSCGDSFTDTGNGETCDDGNTATETCAYGQTSCTVCDSTCASVAGAASYCGDSTTDAANSETCDDGNTTTEACAYGQTSCMVCDSTCASVAGATSYCGDSTTDATNSETCDDGNTTTEACTYGQTSCTVCDSTCASAAGATSYCGDSITDATNNETCDDGNNTGGDGCAAVCTVETIATNAWITIPAGDFVMGCAAADTNCISDESPKHTVTLNGYKIQKYEVTNAQYAACVDATVCTAPATSTSSTRTPYYGNATYDNYPVIYVDWNQANAYCAWKGARLPTEAEWEKSARGPYPAEPIYPWGDGAANCTLMNYSGCTGDTGEVGSHPAGASYYGVMDMSGNVWEWVNDWYDATYYTTGGPPWNNPQGPGTGSYWVIRGTSWNGIENYARVSFRSNYSSIGNDIGFRCAQN